ncbi:MAG: hypothetical protein VW270_19245 [Candidatus Poseidoniales archaeon]|jgi:hypothetical protein
MFEYTGGALPSASDIRTFSYSPIGMTVPMKGGKRYLYTDIQDQSRVGICTAIHLTQNAGKAYGKRFSADFQYLCQKMFHDRSWNEGSSILAALWVAKNIGLLEEKDWEYTKQRDRSKGYEWYIEKLKNIPQKDIERLVQKAKRSKYRVKAFASVPVDRDSMADAILQDINNAGILARFDLGNEWWTKKTGENTNDKNYIEPLRPPRLVISGHAVTISNFDGGSFRIANTWGNDWADNGTAYFLLRQYRPTECWRVWYENLDKLPLEIEQQLAKRSGFGGKTFDVLERIRRIFFVV